MSGKVKVSVINLAPAAFVIGSIALAFLGCYWLTGLALVCALLST